MDSSGLGVGSLGDWHVLVSVERLRGTSRNGTSLSSLRSRGMASTRSLMTLRAISVVPPPMRAAWRIRKFDAAVDAAVVLGPGGAPGPATSKADRQMRAVVMSLNRRDERRRLVGGGPLAISSRYADGICSVDQLEHRGPRRSARARRGRRVGRAPGRCRRRPPSVLCPWARPTGSVT